jgi:hypothetical protein
VEKELILKGGLGCMMPAIFIIIIPEKIDGMIFLAHIVVR